jgi:hydroxymethylpyrimidine/phosphomethylpyrimidine kinase
MKKVLTIAGSDCSGGAGIQADLKTFSAHGVFGMSVIAAVTAENTQRVIDVQNISPDIIGKQIDAVFEDIEVDAVKIGMISEIEGIKEVSEKLRKYKPQNVVLDPVMVSKTGYSLMNPNAVETLIKELIPIVSVVTPNIPEAEIISNIKIKTVEDMEKAAKIIYTMGPKNVLIKGGHLTGDATDVLYDGKEFVYLESERINTKNTHGTGCTLSSSIASNLALGMDIKKAVENAKKYITTAIEHSLPIGHGSGPTNHFYELYKKAGLNYE